MLPESTFLSSAKSLGLRNYVRVASTPSHKHEDVLNDQSPCKKMKVGASTSTDIDSLEEVLASDDDWLEILPLLEKLRILQESYDAGSNAAIKKVECSFCGALEAVDSISSTYFLL
ncbi:hypothetical protein K435DRAFT_851148 [Dendrothele bispora CBS 962.96]|uniref:Uncharacterized protein n=1 Tax=Dendrothele bispora (strain CBS 962.96) TaxID=1314807 RepID=A0A4S8MMK9_DENBC|nr:hypothetical protein K435DRAFT_851148 [Dendrothele bispora CBS 962.96]